MSPTEKRKTDDIIMYKYRTTACTKKRCRNPSKCFHAHSRSMKRRVPQLKDDGTFNYIPKVCPEWEKEKKCRLENSCSRSHGFLEVIYHPLLYKTKVCKSNHKNGVCREYGVYCAFAQNMTEVRDLVKIYGERWKQLYDLASHEKNACSLGTVTGDIAVPLGTRSDCKVSKDCLKDKTTYLDKPIAERNLLKEKVETKSSESGTVADQPKSSPIPFWSPPLFGTCRSMSDLMADFSLGDYVASYTELYSKKFSLWASAPSGVSNFVKQFRDDLKTCDHDLKSESTLANRDKENGNMESKLSDFGNMENQKQGEQQQNSNSLFARFNYGDKSTIMGTRA